MYNCQSFCDSVVNIHDGIISNVRLAVISNKQCCVPGAKYSDPS